jgi:hypothetical protein
MKLTVCDIPGRRQACQEHLLCYFAKIETNEMRKKNRRVGQNWGLLTLDEVSTMNHGIKRSQPSEPIHYHVLTGVD